MAVGQRLLGLLNNLYGIMVININGRWEIKQIFSFGKQSSIKIRSDLLLDCENCRALLLLKVRTI